MDYSKLSVLVIDDAQSMRHIIKMHLEDMGFTIFHEAFNGIEALKTLEAQSIDLILSDVNMPMMSGMEFMKKVRENEKYNSLPCIFITAEVNDEIVKQTEGLNAKILKKPFEEEDLYNIVEKALN